MLRTAHGDEKIKTKRKDLAMSQLGKRYECKECGTVILCTKPGEGNPVCCGKEMEVQQPKKKPSSD